MAIYIFLVPQRIEMTSDDKRDVKSCVKSCRVTFRLAPAILVLEECAQASPQSFRWLRERIVADERLVFMIAHRTRWDKLV